MKFVDTPLQDAKLIELEPIADDRGFFSRAWCSREIAEAGIESRLEQINLSYNWLAGTLRGMHFQKAPYEEAKLIRCIQGALYDVIIDLRADSSTRGQVYGVELSARNRLALYVPAGFAHGFQTLEPDTEAFYFVSEFYTPGAESGIRYDDPRFDIQWPLPVSAISDKDGQWPDFDFETD